MKRHLHGNRRLRCAVIGAIASVYLTASFQLSASELQVNRYSMYSATPTTAQQNLLAATVTLRFPARIQSVGESIQYLLQRSGYRLADPAVAEDETRALFALPLPAVHRSLGPMALRDALQTLAGQAFYLMQDPVHRLITFERCRAPWADIIAADANTAGEGVSNGP